MNIQIGQTYKTRDGGVAVVEVFHQDQTLYQFSGKCFDHNGNYDRLAYWMTNGRYSDSHPSDFDIIESCGE